MNQVQNLHQKRNPRSVTEIRKMKLLDPRWEAERGLELLLDISKLAMHQ